MHLNHTQSPGSFANQPATALIERLAVPADASALDEIVHLAYRSGQSSVDWKNEHHLVSGPRINQDQIVDLINRQDSAIIVLAAPDTGANVAHTVIACAHVEKQDELAHIGLIAVHPAFQNLGLGRRVIACAEAHAKNVLRCRVSQMEVLSGRPELMSFYERLGYASSGQTARFPAGPETGLTPRDVDAHFRVIIKTLD